MLTAAKGQNFEREFETRYRPAALRISEPQDVLR